MFVLNFYLSVLINIHLKTNTFPPPNRERGRQDHKIERENKTIAWEKRSLFIFGFILVWLYRYLEYICVKSYNFMYAILEYLLLFPTYMKIYLR